MIEGSTMLSFQEIFPIAPRRRMPMQPIPMLMIPIIWDRHSLRLLLRLITWRSEV